MIFDTHTHLNDACFDPDREELLRQLPARGVGAFTEIGYDLPSSERARSLAEAPAWEGTLEIYAAIGLHPDSAKTVSEETLSGLCRLAASPKVVAIGEIGLDYHYTDSAGPEAQRRCYTEMLHLGRELGLPVVLHSRDAAKDTYELLVRNKGYENGGIVHCFSYSPEVAEQYVKLGMHIGVGGVLTFPNGRRLKEVAARIPLSSIVLETDCPYMAPTPLRGSRNEPGNLCYVIEELARIKGVSSEEVLRITEENARRVYRISRSPA